MKHFANCNIEEFITQAQAFRAPFAEWLEKTGIPELRKRMPDLPEDMPQADKVRAIAEQNVVNMGDIFAAAIEADPEGTRRLLCLATFTDPADFASHTFVEYMRAVNEMFASEEVRGFFTYYSSPA